MSVARPRPQLDFSRYDIMLAVIPMVFVAAFVLMNILNYPVTAGVAVGATISSIFIVDSLFINPPTGVNES